MKLFTILYPPFLSHRKQCERIQQMLDNKAQYCSKLEEKVTQLNKEMQGAHEDHNARLGVIKLL